MQAENPKIMVKNMFYELIEKGLIDDETMDRYILPTYRQWVNGICLDYVAFKMHLKKQRETIASMKVTFNKLIGELDTVFSNHLVDVYKKDGSHLCFHVMAQFTIINNKLTACDELTRLIKGEDKDADLGHRY